VAAAGFIGYAVLFLARNFTNSFLELGIGHLGLSYLATLVFVVGALLSGKGLLDARRTTGSS
jgi:hypothetical protein